MIPFFDLKRQYKLIQDELDTASREVNTGGIYISGYEVHRFERSFAEYLKAKHCITCGNGTDAIEIVLKAWGIGSGDEVIVPAFTWVSDAEAVLTVGATPVFVDIEDEYYGIDPHKLKEKVNEKTKAIIAVHLFGHACKIKELMDFAKKHDLLVLEDAAQSHGAMAGDKKVGSLGNAAIFSFYPTKNLGAYGDAGAIVTDDEMLASKVRLIANHGQPERDHHVLAGRNSRMDELQAAFLNVKLKFLEDFNNRRRAHADFYNENLKDQLIKPKTSDHARHVYHQYVIRVEERDLLKQYLEENSIGTAIHYPAPLPATIPFYEEKWAEKYPVATNASETILSLPVFPELSHQEAENIVNELNKYF